ncbi:MAG: IS110 family transposase [Chloroflexi bacterium]|nr:IS110 family transposase [Chloroflexota bacterium]
MRLMVKCGAGIDVHKKNVVVNCRRVEGKEVETETRSFGTTTPELLQMTDWLASWGVTDVAMESTGVYWHPVYNLLEGSYEVKVVNAKHIKHVPGRKTDVKDAEWIAELLSYGLLKASFVPEKPQRDMRDLTRYRTKLVQERAREANRVQKLLEGANIKLASVATDVLGVSGRLMLKALIEGNASEKEMAEMAKGRMRSKIPELEKALTGIVSDHHRFMLGEQLAHIDFMDGQIANISQEISVRLEKMSQNQQPPTPSEGANKTEAVEDVEKPLTWQAAVELLDTVPGINQRAAEAILAETGIDMGQFPEDKNLTAWAGLAPGNNESGGKRYSGRTRKGNQTLKTTMIQVAHAARRKKGSYASALYKRLVGRRGKKRAIVAVARSLLVSIYHMLTRQEAYKDLGSEYFQERRKENKVDYLTRQLSKLGYEVQLMPQLDPTPAE